MPTGSLRSGTEGSELRTYLEERRAIVEKALERLLPGREQFPSLIHRAIHHSLFAGGKRLRPILVIASAEAVGGEPEMVLPTACAVELIHTYSLIHDDLPSMDNADTRRGLPTCHRVYGEAMAVLAGDALHALAFELLTQNAVTAGPERALAVIEEIARAIGTGGMVGGQVLDLLGERAPQEEKASLLAILGDVQEEDSSPRSPLERLVYRIHRMKTASLIRACVRAGAILAGGSDGELKALTEYGESLGLAYQIVDDILDVIGEEEVLGKQAGSDAARSKVTFPAVFGLDRSIELARAYTEQAVAALTPLGERGRVLGMIARYLLEREQ
ncbi:MAG: polyprenyl synthetase family protein [Armatimonadota bacterium]|nr:polyprenyl synthetase family protein [Armatimonadota bacterium]MDR5703114.1 polyprenyl synthetase family protein [Armatimonadota bacterium]